MLMIVVLIHIFVETIVFSGFLVNKSINFFNKLIQRDFVYVNNIPVWFEIISTGHCSHGNGYWNEFPI